VLLYSVICKESTLFTITNRRLYKMNTSSLVRSLEENMQDSNVTLMGAEGDVLYFAVSAGKYRNLTVVYDVSQGTATAEEGTLTLHHQPENRVEVIPAPEGFEEVRQQAQQRVLQNVAPFVTGGAR
jgi:hypothetical protein